MILRAVRRPLRLLADDTYLAGEERVGGRVNAYALVRASVFLLGALGALILPGVVHRGSGVLIALVAAMSQPLIARLKRLDPDLAFIAADLVLFLAITVVEPAYWNAGLVLVVASTVWLGIRQPTRRYIPIVSVILTFLAAAGALWGPDIWIETWLASLLVFVLMGWRGHDIRRAFLESQSDLQQSLSASGAIVHFSLLDEDRVAWVMGDVLAVTGWDPDQWLALDHQELLHPDDTDFWLDAEEAVPGRTIDRKGRFLGEDGEWRWVRDISRVIIDGRGRKAIRGFSLNVTDIEQAHEMIRAQSRRDQLTGLPNRFELESELGRLEHEQAPYALFMLDMNRFKEINDTLGHGVGDDVLRRLGSRLRSLIREHDLVSRVGGDEFAVILRGATATDTAIDLAERIATECNQPYDLGTLSIAAPVSVGIAMSTEDSIEFSDMLRRADIAMYTAKRRGVDHVVFTDDLERVSVEQLSLSAAMAAAIDNDEFVLHYQPKVNLTTGEVEGIEGLARWHHPERGLLHPNTFLDLVTLSNAYQAFTDKVLEQGISFAARCRAIGHRVPVAVNVSVRSLHDPDFVSRLILILDRHDVPAEDLVLEVTEQDLHLATEGSALVLRTLTRIGVQLSIDDFGTGFSSLQRLRDLQVNELKIDRSFVEALSTNERDRVIVGSIVDLGLQLGHRVVAEGVEDEQQASLLAAFGCTSAQGYWFSRALEADALLDRLAADPLAFTGGGPRSLN